MNKQDVKEEILVDSRNLTFVEYCDYLKDKKKEVWEKDTPLESFFIALSKKTGRHVGSVRRWYYGTAKPDLLAKKATAELTGIKVETLWPSVAC